MNNTLLILVTVLVCLPLAANADVVLSEKIVKLAMSGAELSSLAYEEDPPGDGFEHFGFYDSEPDQALVAERDGYCFAAFRGTTLTWTDWQQNFELGKKDICVTEFFGNKHCCSTRSGFYKAYHTSYYKKLEAAVRKCAKTCTNPNECVVFTGHSQGGAIAAVAGLAMADLNPYVITFGQPATIDAPCTMIASERWYRFVNTKSSDVGIAYDPIPFVPGMGADFFGHMILLGEDPTGVAYIGLDANDDFGPLNINGFEAHSMIAGADVPFPGYSDRLKTLVANNSTLFSSQFPIRSNGYADSTLCSENKECLSGKCGRETTFSFPRCIGTECDENSDCASNRCDSGSCMVKEGSCMSCDEDSDCAGGTCLLFHCSSSTSNLMDDNCICKWDTDCHSGRCELFETGMCEAQLAVGARCNEDSDCKSSYCTWRFKCDEKKLAGAFCGTSSNCDSGSCSWRFRCNAATTTTTTKSSGVAIEAMALPSSSSLPTATSQHASVTSQQHFHSFIAGGTLFLSVLCVALVKYAAPAYRRRRDGYEEVVTELTV